MSSLKQTKNKQTFFCGYGPCYISEFMQKIYNKNVVQGTGHLRREATWSIKCAGIQKNNLLNVSPEISTTRQS